MKGRLAAVLVIAIKFQTAFVYCSMCLALLAASYRKSLLTFFACTFLCGLSFSQKYYFGCDGKLWYDSIPNLFCDGCYWWDKSYFDTDYLGGLSFGPDGTLYSMGNVPTHTIYEINPENADATIVFTYPLLLPNMGGMLAMGNGIFYSVPHSSQSSDSLYVWDVNAGTVTSLGQLSFKPTGELWLANGEMYYIGNVGTQVQQHIVKIDLADPSNSESVLAIPTEFDIRALTASPHASLFVGAEIGYPEPEMVSVNIIDGTITYLCHIDKFWIGHEIYGIASIYEHQSSVNETFIDLDCDNNSMATGSDFNGLSIDCFTEGGVAVADTDVVIRIDEYIDYMIFEMADPLDGVNEIFTLAGPTPGVYVDGEDTPTLTFFSEGGTSIASFENALHQVRYDNISLSPTGGVRTINVRIITQSGSSESNTARAFIEVIEIQQHEVDIGPDIEICEGGEAELDAGPFAEGYVWSTGETTQTIVVDDEGIYSVTVSAYSQCPGADEISVTEIPIINLWLTGDTIICNGDDAELIITSDADFPVDVEITISPGGVFNFESIEGNYTFTEPLYNITELLITNVDPSEPACIQLADDNQLIEVAPDYSDTSSINLCDGDSILIGNVWQKENGFYTEGLQTIHGCDSVVNYQLTFVSSAQLFLQEKTCDSTAVGVYTSVHINPAGCDTLVTRTVSLYPSDTTLLYFNSCKSSEVGISETILSNALGCDSVIITVVTWIPPSDTTLLIQSSCDPTQWGTSYQFLQSNDGCDSIVSMIVVADTPDTTHLFLTSCNVANLGVFVDHYATANACDSTVITTVTFSERDSTFITGISCNPAETGIFVETFTNTFGCDSVVTENISLAASSETFISSTTCDPSSAGNFTYTLTNQNGCDSIVNESVSLLPESETLLTDVTCRSSEAGVFISNYINQYGCDSTVTLTVSLLPAIQTEINNKTCDPSQVGNTEIIHVATNGCDSIVIQTTELFPLPQLQIDVADFNGYGVSCAGSNDGGAEAIANGEAPFSFEWSTGSAEPSINGLTAGFYSLSITDANGCTTESSFSIVEPEPLSLALLITEPDCFDQQEGAINVEHTGGVEPILYSIDQVNFQSSSNFNSLPSGTYQITALDHNDCKTEEIIWINVPMQVNVNLGEDQLITGIDTVFLHAVTSIPFDSIASVHWSGLSNQECPSCLTQPVSPIITTTYSVTVTSIDGCYDEDDVTLSLETNSDLFIPNIFSPNGDNLNDYLVIGASPDIEEINSLIIFDRWGNAVFSKENFPPNDDLFAWDGSWNGKQLNPNVFAYRMIAQTKDGRQIIRCGDITLIR